ncbi:glutathione S-transferase family protein [bacterium]|nr:glutathione S-transferase family protein [bacterium]
MLPRDISKLTFYGDCNSGNCMKVRWVADMLGVDYDWVEIDVTSGTTRTEAFLALNPAGQVPLARWPDGRSLAQSNAIMLYLCDTTPGGERLVPADPFRRAQMTSWLFWEQYSHETAIAVRRFQKAILNKSDDEIDPTLLPKGRRALGVMELQLTYSDYLVGDALTLADVALVAYTRWAHEGGFDLGEFPAVDRWVRRVEFDLGVVHAREVA